MKGRRLSWVLPLLWVILVGTGGLMWLNVWVGSAPWVVAWCGTWLGLAGWNLGRSQVNEEWMAELDRLDGDMRAPWS